MKKILSFDIGGTKIAYNVVEQTGELLYDTIKISTPKTAEQIFNTLKSIADKFDDMIDGVAIATAGAINRDNNKIITIPSNLAKGYKDIDFAKISSKPVYLENDANAAMWAEYKLGNAKNTLNSLMIAIGTGVGLSIVVEGNILRGKSGAAGEAHFMVNKTKKRQCTCGMYDCYEAYASGTALGTMAKEIYNDSSKTGHDIILGLKNNDKASLDVWNKWLYDVATGITGLCNIFDPEVIVLFGSLSEFIDYDKFQAMVDADLMGEPAKIIRAKFENNAAIIGGAMGLLDKIK